MLWLVVKSKQLPYFKAFWSQPDLNSEFQQIAQILFQGKTWFSLSLPHSLFLFIFLFFPISFYLLPILSSFCFTHFFTLVFFFLNLSFYLYILLYFSFSFYIFFYILSFFHYFSEFCCQMKMKKRSINGYIYYVHNTFHWTYRF